MPTRCDNRESGASPERSRHCNRGVRGVTTVKRWEGRRRRVVIRKSGDLPGWMYRDPSEQRWVLWFALVLLHALITRSPFSEFGFFGIYTRHMGCDEMGVKIRVDSLSFLYGTQSVFSNVSLAVEPGSFTGVVGPNGAGKTTLLKCLAGLLRPSSGRVRLGDDEVSSLSREAMARIVAVVPQDNQVRFDFTVEEFVMLGRLPHHQRVIRETRHDREVVARAIALTGMEAFACQSIVALSGGERQRAAISRALAQEPKVLLLDEPTSHLDIGHQVDVLDLVHGMCAGQGVTVVGVFHDLNLASMYCDQIIMMADGTARLHGTPRKVLTQRNVEAIYGDRVVVDQHPVCGVPLVVPVSGRAANRSALRQENSEREDMNA